MMTGCCTLPPREAPAIPLWINGRPVLAMPTMFHEIREAATQRLIRRVPMVDQVLAATAVANASQAQGLSPEATRSFLDSLVVALDELAAEEAAGRLVVIRPSRPLAVGRYSQDRAQLERLYQNGFADAAACADQLRDFLSP